MEVQLHHVLHLLYFMMAPIAMLFVTVLAAAVRHTRSSRSDSQTPAGKSPASPSRYSHALEQQELDHLMEDLDHGQPRRGYSALSHRH